MSSALLPLFGQLSQAPHSYTKRALVFLLRDYEFCEKCDLIWQFAFDFLPYHELIISLQWLAGLGDGWFHEVTYSCFRVETSRKFVCCRTPSIVALIVIIRHNAKYDFFRDSSCLFFHYILSDVHYIVLSKKLYPETFSSSFLNFEIILKTSYNYVQNCRSHRRILEPGAPSSYIHWGIFWTSSYSWHGDHFLYLWSRW